MRASVLLLMLGGCLIVEVSDENTGGVCPPEQWQVITGASGPLALSGDQIYYIRAGTALSRIATSGGPITDLAPVLGNPWWLVVDASSAYWAVYPGFIDKAPLTGGVSTAVADDITEITNLAVDNIGIVYASSGLYRIRHSDGTVEMLADGEAISGVAQYNGTYFFADVGLGMIRRTQPVVDLATARFPGALTADDRGVYYYENGMPSETEAGGAIRVIDPQGGSPVAIVENMRAPAVAMALDAENLFFATNVAGDYRILRVSRSGGQVRRLACNYSRDAPTYLALDADFVYWSDAKQIYRIAKTML